MEEFEGYLQAPHDLPPLIRLALIHYQFEAIHPFVDGNGRSGRLLISLLLVHWGLLSAPILYLSAFFEKNREDYYDLLLAVTERGEWREWVGFFLEGVLQQAKDASKRAKHLQDLQAKWRAMLGGSYDATSQVLADSLFGTPYITVRHAQQVLGLKSYMGAQKNVQKLIKLGILRPAPNSKPEKLFVASEIIEILTAEE